MAKLNFQHHFSLQGHLIRQKTILLWWFNARETFIIIINVESGFVAKSFCGNRNTFSSVFLNNW